MKNQTPLGLFAPTANANRSSPMPRFDFDLCASRADTFRMIPDVRRNLAIAAFEAVVEEVREGRYAGPLDLKADDVVDIVGVRGQFDTLVVTPKGARLLLRLLEAGLIPQKPGTNFARKSPDLAAYAARDEEIAEETSKRAARGPEEVRQEAQEERRVLQERIGHLARHPEDAQPNEIKRWIIDKVFIERVGYGVGGSMSFGSVTCHKEIHHWVSNKGYRNTEIVIWWTEAAGKRNGDSAFTKPINRRARGGENIHKYNRDLRDD